MQPKQLARIHHPAGAHDVAKVELNHFRESCVHPYKELLTIKCIALNDPSLMALVQLMCDAYAALQEYQPPFVSHSISPLNRKSLANDRRFRLTLVRLKAFGVKFEKF